VKSGVELSAYNTLEDAADVHALIQALGYRQVTLYGASYGTRLALTVMRLFPGGIRSVVLDSVEPPQENAGTSVAGSAQRVFETLFRGCTLDAHCNKAYPQLRTTFYELVTKLDKQPITFTTTDVYYTGKTYTVLFAGSDLSAGGDLVQLLFAALYNTQLIGQLPAMIFQASKGDYTLLSQIFGQAWFSTLSWGMYYSVECGEDYAFTTPQALLRATQVLLPQAQPAFDNRDQYSICRVWNVKPVPSAQKKPVMSDIPTLVLSGEYDPITPPANGQLTAQALKHSYFFLFPGTGHGVEYNSSCADEIIHAFEDNPIQKPDSSCLAHLSEPVFQ